MFDKTMGAFFILTAVTGAVAGPAATITAFRQNADLSVTAVYDLSEDAVVTFDVRTNGVSIGGRALSCVDGDVNRKVGRGSGRTITWRPDVSWPGHALSDIPVRAYLTAWPTNDTPDYLVVDLKKNSMNADADPIRYYVSADHLPGGLLPNRDYRTSKMVFRRIPARNVTWKMGFGDAAFDVTLSRDYYIAVFELTQAQVRSVNHSANHDGVGYYSGVEHVMRAVDNRAIFCDLRGGEGCRYPDPPDGARFIGLVRAFDPRLATLDFPSEAEWEFACRAGNDDAAWGDGSPVEPVDGVDENLSRIARYAKNDGLIGGTLNPYNTLNYVIGPTNGVAIVGTYEPNAWGLYDMHGNVQEYCLDVWKSDISSDAGAVIVDRTSDVHVLKGGRYSSAPGDCRAGKRSNGDGSSSAGGGFGCRLAIRAGLD